VDVDVDVDADLDVDMDADVDTDLDVDHGGGILASFGRFMHAGDIPVTVILSGIVLSMWVVSVVTNHALGNESGLLALAMSVPICIGSLFVTKALLFPFVPLLRRAFDEKGDSVEILGKPCVVSSLEATSKYGQAEITTTGAPIVINVKTREGLVLKRGDEAVVYEIGESGDVFYIAGLNMESEDEAVPKVTPQGDREISGEKATDRTLDTSRHNISGEQE